jgi:hypothetical protein
VISECFHVILNLDQVIKLIFYSYFMYPLPSRVILYSDLIALQRSCKYINISSVSRNLIVLCKTAPILSTYQVIKFSAYVQILHNDANYLYKKQAGYFISWHKHFH